MKVQTVRKFSHAQLMLMSAVLTLLIRSLGRAGTSNTKYVSGQDFTYICIFGSANKRDIILVMGFVRILVSDIIKCESYLQNI